MGRRSRGGHRDAAGPGPACGNPERRTQLLRYLHPSLRAIYINVRRQFVRHKRKTVWAYLDGRRLVDVVQAALDNNMTVDDVKALLVQENPGHVVTFRVEV